MAQLVTVVDAITSSPVVSAVGAIAVAATSSIIARWWQRQREADDSVERWYQDALGFIGRLQQAGHRATSYKQADYPTLREKLEPVAEGMQEHAMSAPNGVDEQARVELVYLAAFATGLINLTKQAEDVSSLEFFQLVQDHAQENYSGEYDIEDVNQFIESLDVDALAERMDSDVETNDEAIDDFFANFSEESLAEERPTSIDEALEMPLDQVEDAVADDEWLDEMFGDTLREYVQLILLDLSEDVVVAMEKRKQRV